MVVNFQTVFCCILFRKKKKKEPISMARLDDIERFLSKKPKGLTRSESMIKMSQPVVRELRVSRYCMSTVHSIDTSCTYI